MKIELNLNNRRKFSGEPMEALADLYLQMLEEDALIAKMSEDVTDKALRKNKPRLLRSLENVKKMEQESSVIAAYLPPVWESDDFLLLHGCSADVTEYGLKYEIVPVIYHNYGEGNISRAIDLFVPEVGLAFDEKLSWNENVEKAVQRHKENELVVREVYPSRPDFAAAEHFLVEACEEIKGIDPAIIKERLIQTEKIVHLAEKKRADKIKKNSYTLEKSGMSVKEKILEEQKKERTMEINRER